MAIPAGYRIMRPAELEAAGYSPRSQRVLTPEGDIISRRQAENVGFQTAGFKSWHAWQELRPTIAARELSEREFSALTPAQQRRVMAARSYERDIGKAMQTTGKTYGQLRAPHSEFNRLAMGVRDERKAGRVDKSPDGALGRLLTYIGRRAPGDPWDVGDTDAKRKGGGDGGRSEAAGDEEDEEEEA